MAKKTVLITGVYGLVGSAIYRRLLKSPEKYEVYGMARRAVPSERVSDVQTLQIPESHFLLSDLSDLKALTQDFEGMDTVVHMAADPNTEAPWDSVLKNNIEAGYHMFEAAKRAGVRRVVCASTIQVSTGHFRNREPYKSIWEENYRQVPDSIEPLKTTERPWPINLYAASKVFAETLARVYSSSSDLSCLCLRIGAVNAEDEITESRLQSIFCSQNDVARLTEACIQAPDTLKFDIFYGMSQNKYLWTDIENAASHVGYIPADGRGKAAEV